MGGNYNPFAAAVLNGVNPTAPGGFVDVDYTYVYDVTLTALQLARDQQVPIHTDADFLWRGILQSSTGVYAVRFGDSQGYYLSSSLVANVNLSNDPTRPTPIFPELFFPAGGRILVDIQDMSSAPNTVQVCFRGVKRYRAKV